MEGAGGVQGSSLRGRREVWESQRLRNFLWGLMADRFDINVVSIGIKGGK